jgi:hypothetical protein
MIDHQRKLIFIHIARTGGTSIEAALVGCDWWDIDPASKHLSAAQTRQLYGEEFWNAYLKFTVVRNPWDRLVSMWATGWWHTTPPQADAAEFRTFVRQLRPHPHERYGSLFYHEILDEPIDRVLRFERLAEEFRDLLRDVGSPDVPLPHRERRNRGNFRDYYDPETRDLVGRLFARDIEQYGYSF